MWDHLKAASSTDPAFLLGSIYQCGPDDTELNSPDAAVEMCQSESQEIYQICLRPRQSWPQSEPHYKTDNQSVPLESCCVKWKMPLCWPLLWTRLHINVLERSELTHVSILGQSRNICHLWFFSFNASNFHLSVMVADNKPNESYIYIT